MAAFSPGNSFNPLEAFIPLCIPYRTGDHGL